MFPRFLSFEAETAMEGRKGGGWGMQSNFGILMKYMVDVYVNTNAHIAASPLVGLKF